MPRPACPLGPRGALALALGPLSSPLPVSWLPPPVPHALARPLSHLPSPCPLHLGSLPVPLHALPVPWPLPALCPESRRLLPALCSPPLLRPSWTTRRASRCLCSCGSVTPGGERLRAGGRTCRSRRGGKGLGGNGLGGLVWVWVGLAWARYFALSLPTAAAAGSSLACAACWESRRGRPRRWCGPPGPRSQSLARPSCSLRRLRQPSAMRLVLAPGLSPVSAACRGPRSGPRRGSLGLRSPLPARLGPPPGAGRRGWLLGWRRRSSRPAQAPGPAAAARAAPLPPPASAPRAPRGSPPSTPGRRRGSGSGTGGGGGRPAGGTHRSLPSLLPW